MALGHLSAAGFDIGSPEIVKLLGASEQETSVLHRMIERGINTPLTSSCGRLFDAVAAMVLNRRRVDYEAQAAIELEGVAIDEGDQLGSSDYVLQQHHDGDRIILKFDSLWRAIVRDIERGTQPAQIAAQFHSGVAEGFVQVAMAARDRFGIRAVAMSGGCMHNRRLSALLRDGLEKQGFKVYRQVNVSPGDGGLSYGQAAVAAAILRREQ
jgi:hydrogenase maturation protein HypF